MTHESPTDEHASSSDQESRYTCERCGESFDTLTRKRLHDCDAAYLPTHGIPEELPAAVDVLPETRTPLPDTAITMAHAAALDDDPALTRFFPIQSLGELGSMHRWRVITGYANTGDRHVLIALNTARGTWVVIESNSSPEFSCSELELASWLVAHNPIDGEDIVSYTSNSPDYPTLDA